MSEYATEIASFISGAVIGYGSHWLQVRESRKDRLRSFASFLSGWRSKCERLAPDDTDGVATNYMAHVSDFKALAETVRGDFKDSATFDRLCTALGDLRGADIQENGRDKICTAIDQFIAATPKA